MKPVPAPRLSAISSKTLRILGNCAPVLMLVVCFSARTLLAADAPRRFPLPLKPTDVIATGNEWISLPTIRAADGALANFNVLSMRDRGLLEVAGEHSSPVLAPYIKVAGHPVPLRDLSWELLEYWIPVAHLTTPEVEITLTYCAPPDTRAAFIHVTLTNRRAETVPAVLGIRASWGALHRVTYTPVELRGERSAAAAAWMDAGEVFSYATHDTQFAWSMVHPGAVGHILAPPEVFAPAADAQKEVTVAAGQTASADFIIAAGLEEFTAPHSAKALREAIDRYGADKIVNDAAVWCRARTRTTGQPDLDMLMNRNFLFSALYAWGKTMDTEQFVGVTSRSPRYYVSAAYWDRDAMLWSFPGLLDVDPSLAREALEYALTTQLRNTGIHSRFIDGVVLEDGFQLDEGVAPILATAAYMRRTNDDAFLASHRGALTFLRDRLLGRFDPETGLYSSLQDSQDEYQKPAFMIYDNVLSWRAMLDLAELLDRQKDHAAAQDMIRRAAALRTSIMKFGISDQAPGATGPIFVSATDGKTPLFTDVPPGSLVKLAMLGFVKEDDPIFARTYDWLHSKNYKYSHADRKFGLPGSYRLPITTSWSVADHLRLARGREQALNILRASSWDAGIISEGLDPDSAVMDNAGGAFATAAGYVAHSICEVFCQDHESAAAREKSQGLP